MTVSSEVDPWRKPSKVLILSNLPYINLVDASTRKVNLLSGYS